jgi:RNase H-fold protein (predicted Holliday junction resolvase)
VNVVLAVDPGSMKCGIAVVSSEGVVIQTVLPREGIEQAIKTLAGEHSVEKVLLGNGTGSDALARSLDTASLGVPVEIVEESYTTLQARDRFFRENPPRGLRRLIPIGLQTPDRPYDDHVAAILGERYLQSHPE